MSFSIDCEDGDNFNQQKKEEEHHDPNQPKTIEEHRGVIEFTPVGKEKIGDTNERQAAHARPNERLKIVFGIDNAFTTRNMTVSRRFVGDSIKKIQNAINLDSQSFDKKDGDWSKLRELAQGSVEQLLSQPEEKLKIVDLVRVVTLKVSLRFLFNVSDNAINSEDSKDNLILIGQKINDLWIASKKNPLPKWRSDTNSELHQALKAVCKTDEGREINPEKSGENPMNWLLPAYETMWRVVLACVIELRFRNAKNANHWCKTLTDYTSDISREKFKGNNTTPGVRGFCANDIVKEALRLYPPTRRVHRSFKEDEKDVKADIEFCHRSNDAFGPDPHCFRPGRWFYIREHLVWEEKGDKHVKSIEEKLGFMPFAVHCPAGKGETQAFGFKMIALLAGVLCEALEKHSEWVLEKSEDYQDLTKPLPSDREAFDEGYLFKKSDIGRKSPAQ